MVDGADCDRVDCLVRRIDDLALPEHVIDGDQAAAPHQFEGIFVIRVIIGFVGVDESEIERIALSGDSRFGSPETRVVCVATLGKACST